MWCIGLFEEVVEGVIKEIKINEKSPFCPFPSFDLASVRACVHAQSLSYAQLSTTLTLRDPMDCSLPGSAVHEIFQAITLDGVGISSSRALASIKDQRKY